MSSAVEFELFIFNQFIKYVVILLLADAYVDNNIFVSGNFSIQICICTFGGGCLLSTLMYLHERNN